MRTPIRRLGGQRSFLFWLVSVQMLAVVPLLAVAAWAIHALGQRHEAEALDALQRRVGIAADAVARQTEGVKMRLRLLAAQDARNEDDLEDIQRFAASLLRTDLAILGVAASDERQRAIFSTSAVQLRGSTLSALPRDLDHSDQAGDVAMSGLAKAASEQPVLWFVTPWTYLHRSHLLQMSLKPAAIGTVLQEQRWPDRWVAAVIDQNMAIVARSRDEASFVGKQATESAQKLIRSRSTGISYAITKDGTEAVTALAPIPGTPWWVIAGLPRRALADAVMGPFRTMVMGGIVLVLLGIGASLALSRYLHSEVRDAADGSGLVTPLVREFGSLSAKRLMLENDLVGMVRLVERRAVWHNPAFEQMFGYSDAELDGHSPRLMHPSDSSFETFGQRAYAAISTGERFRESLEMVRKDGSPIWVDVSGVGLPDGSTLWMLLDITAQRAEHDRMANLAFHDPLTGLANRALFEDRLRQAMLTAAREHRTLAVCLLDLNGFKAVNDTRGHAVGDALLRVVASRLEGCTRASDTVARLGGDEFVLLLPQLARVSETDAALLRVRESISRPIVVDAHECHVSAAIGVALFPGDGTSWEDLVRCADARMYEDKARLKALTEEGLVYP